MPREKITFASNIPTQVILDSAGELQRSATNGAEEYRYFLGDNRIMWVPPDVHEAIEQAQAAEGDLVTITKRKAGKAAATWTVETHQQQPEPTRYGYGQASPAAAPRPAPTPAPPQPAAPQQPGTRSAEAPLTATDKLAGALAAAIDAAAEASIYAQRRGLTLAWGAGDIRALAATLYIEHSKAGR